MPLSSYYSLLSSIKIFSLLNLIMHSYIYIPTEKLKYTSKLHMYIYVYINTCHCWYQYVITAKPKLRDLMQLEITPEWYLLGLELGLTEHTLNVIESDNHGNSSTCKRKMFSKWLLSNKDASYTSLVDALVKIDKVVAENVSQQFCKFCILLGYMYNCTYHVICTM